MTWTDSDLGPQARAIIVLVIVSWDLAGTIFPVEAVIDSVGRIVVPKPLRDALGLPAGQPGAAAATATVAAALGAVAVAVGAASPIPEAARRLMAHDDLA
jgi:hypothetical protein